MNFVTKILEKLLMTEYEEFTQYIITAIALARAEPEFNEGDLRRLVEIRDNTHPHLQTSIYKLDRLIDPSKVSDDPTKWQFDVKFVSDKLVTEDGERKIIKLRSERLQQYLCEAIEEVASIVFKNMWQYNDDIRIPLANEEEKNNVW